MRLEYLLFLPLCIIELLDQGQGCPQEVKHIKERGCTRPLHFSSSIPLIQHDFSNYAKEIFGYKLWTAIPQHESDVVQIANWALRHKYRVRPFGFAQSWSPIVITNGSSCDTTNTILVKMTSLKKMKIIRGVVKPGMVRVQTGASMDSLLAYLEDHGFGLHSYPRSGALTVGGVLAVGGHGTGLRSPGWNDTIGFGFGSLSNLVLDFKAVVWNQFKKRYILTKFSRSDKGCEVLLASLGKTIMTEVTFRVSNDYNLRAVNDFDTRSDELFASSSASVGKRSFTSLMDASDGRLDIFWWPTIDRTWIRLFTIRPTKPPSSYAVSTPYNYMFPPETERVADLFSAVENGDWSLGPNFTLAYLEDVTIPAMTARNTKDIWGPSKNILLNSYGEMELLTTQGFVVITARSNVQNIIHQYRQFVLQLLRSYNSRSIYPTLDPINFRTSGLDDGKDAGIPGAEPPALSPTSPVTDHPEWDTALWISVMNYPPTPYLFEWVTDLESYCLSIIHDGRTAIVRAEWSFTFGYTPDGPFTNKRFMDFIIPSGEPAISTLRKYDPPNTFTNAFLNSFLK